MEASAPTSPFSGLAHDRFRIVTGVFDGARDKVWFRRHLPSDGSVQFEDQSSAVCTIGVWGPDARALLSEMTDTPLSQEAFPYGRVQGRDHRWRAGDHAPHLLRGRERMGDLHEHVARRAPVGRDLGDGSRLRRPTGGNRRLRHDRAAREGIRTHGHRSHRGVLASGGGLGAAPREGRGVHREAGLPAGAGRTSGGEAVYADNGPSQ